MSDIQKELPNLLPQIMASPRLYLHSLDLAKHAALLVDADENFYRNAIVLDQRALGPNTTSAWIPLELLWRHVDAAATGTMATARFIFDAGCSGANLISRLLDGIPPILGLREPLVLRTLATGFHGRADSPGTGFEDLFRRGCQLLLRRFSSQQQIIIQPGSMCNNLAAVLLAQNPLNRGILLFVKLEVFLARMLAREDDGDIDRLLAHRAACLGKIVPDLDVDIAALAQSEKMALSWLTEAAQFYQLTGRGLAPRVLLLDFDRFLARKEDHLEQILRHFSIPAGPGVLDKVLSSGVFDPRSTPPDPDRTPFVREQSLNASRAGHGSAISAGMRFVESLMKTHPDLREIPQKIPLA